MALVTSLRAILLTPRSVFKTVLTLWASLPATVAVIYLGRLSAPNDMFAAPSCFPYGSVAFPAYLRGEPVLFVSTIPYY